MVNRLNTCPTAIDFDVNQPRHPEAGAYDRRVEDHLERLETIWLPAPLPARRVEPTELSARRDCGDLHLGLARVKLGHIHLSSPTIIYPLC